MLSCEKDAAIILVESDESRRKFAASQFPGIRIERHLEDAIQLADAVIVATPAESHFGIAKIALQMGRHVLVEKPLAQTVAEVDEKLNFGIK